MKTEDTLDLSVLPQEVRKQIIEFYEYLVSKYVQPSRTTKKRFAEFVETPIKVQTMVKFKREDLYDRKSSIY